MEVPSGDRPCLKHPSMSVPRVVRLAAISRQQGPDTELRLYGGVAPKRTGRSVLAESRACRASAVVGRAGFEPNNQPESCLILCNPMHKLSCAAGCWGCAVL
jgi:hypothetical protein